LDALYTYPSYLEDIIESLMRRDWLVHNFDNVDTSGVYNFVSDQYRPGSPHFI